MRLSQIQLDALWDLGLMPVDPVAFKGLNDVWDLMRDRVGEQSVPHYGSTTVFLDHGSHAIEGNQGSAG